MVFKEKPIGLLIDELGGYVGLRGYTIFSASDIKAVVYHELFFRHIIQDACRDATSSRASCESPLYMDILSFILENAAEHGNNYDTNLIISMKAIECRDGYILRIRDSGTGFDPEEKLGQMLRGEKYYKNWGYGMRHMSHGNAEMTYENCGTTWNLVIRK